MQYPRDLLLKLCTYFDIQPGELIRMEADENDWAVVKGNEYEEDGNDKEPAQDGNL
ncbi:hypothetical protein D3C73_1590490 [compost metagenome]